MQIDWWSLTIQAINFLILVWLLWRFLYRPVKEVIDKRNKLAEEAFTEAYRRKEAAEAARLDYETDRADLARERQDLIKKIHGELEAERQEVLEDAKRKAEELLETTRADLAQERYALSSDIRKEVTCLAVELAAKLLSDTGASMPFDVLMAHIEKKLGSLATEERARLRKDLEAEGAGLTVVTASPLTPDEKSRLQSCLAGCFGLDDKSEFITDANILSGAELRFPHAVVKFTWADQLRRAEELLKRDQTAS
jgi:F-type H+-transporting ATPase subunit b